jgi:hypothetical protein
MCVNVAVPVRVGVPLTVGVRVDVPRGVLVTVRVRVAVFDGKKVRVGVVKSSSVAVGEAIAVALAVAVADATGVVGVADGVGGWLSPVVAVAVALGAVVRVAVGRVAVAVGLGPGVSVPCVAVAVGGPTVCVALLVAVATGVAGVSVTVGVAGGARTPNRAMKSGAVRRPSRLTSAVTQELPAKTAPVNAPTSTRLATPSQLASPRTPCALAALGNAQTVRNHMAIAAPAAATRERLGSPVSAPTSWLRMAIRPTPSTALRV